MRKRVFQALETVIVSFEDGGIEGPVNLCSGDTLEVTGNGPVFFDHRLRLISDTDPLPDAIHNVDRAVRAYRRELDARPV